jgi:pimeloyl-ACP methyl ester carboxylesterase
MAFQRVRFCTADDDVGIAYALSGSGPPLVRAPHWLTHIEHDWAAPIRRHWLDEFSRNNLLVRFDPRGCGLSERNATDISFDRWVEDLHCVVRAAGVDKFTLFGASQGGAVAVAYAARHPERVERLVLLGAFGRGKLKRAVSATDHSDAITQLKLVEIGWDSDDPAYRQFFASQFMPAASFDEIRSLAEMMRLSAAGAIAAQLIRMFYEIDVTALAGRVRCPTLAFHARGDKRVPHEEGRLLASTIPGARLITLQTDNHMLSSTETEWPRFLAELRAFVPGSAARETIGGLSARETEVLKQLAQGLDNAQISARLGMSEKTVRNHLTHIFEKMQVHHRGEAIVRAREAGLGTPEPIG